MRSLRSRLEGGILANGKKVVGALVSRPYDSSSNYCTFCKAAGATDSVTVQGKDLYFQ